MPPMPALTKDQARNILMNVVNQLKLTFDERETLKHAMAVLSGEVKAAEAKPPMGPKKMREPLKSVVKAPN